MVEALEDQVVGPAGRWLVLVLGAVAFVLLVACVNVGILQLARSASRVAEFATREALGASRAGLATGLLLEGVILGVLSAASGLLLARFGLDVCRSNLPPGLTRTSTIAIDARVLVTGAGAALVSGLVFGSAPAWLAARSDLLGVMKGARLVIGDRRRDRWLRAFLALDAAFVCTLLVATTLMVTSFVLVSTADLGFERQNVMMVNYGRSLNGVAEVDRPAAAAALRADLLNRVTSLPGVVAAAISIDGAGPLSGASVRYGLTVPGTAATDDDTFEGAIVTPDYFRVMGMRLVSGRLLQPSDGADAPHVMLLNDVAARRLFPTGDALGQVVTFRGPTTVVGVLHGVHDPEADVRPAMFIPADQEPPHVVPGRDLLHGVLLVRTREDPRRLSAAVRDAVRAVAGSEPGSPRFLDDLFRRATVTRRFNAGVMSIFGVIAIGIGAIGVYGTMAFFVAQRVRAIGLRMAIGAPPARVMRSVLGEAMTRVCAGIGAGLVGAWACSRALASFVFGIGPSDPRVYAGVAALLTVVGLAGAYLPARRAARLDPIAALREP